MSELSLGAIQDRVHKTQRAPRLSYYALLVFAAACTATGAYCWSRIIRFGMGETHLSRPIGWV